ncbi:MAG: Ni/Fe-hydrogenase, b-type cytochrome subunit [Anaerolineales bacterium]
MAISAKSNPLGEELKGRVYVWEAPVRLTHWVNVAAIVVLSITGFYIGNPVAQTTGREAYSSYLMGTIRFIHFTAAFVFIGSIALRTYWAFVGNRWASWRALAPLFTAEGRGKMMHAIRYYAFLRREPPLVLGHNALAGFTYAIIVLLYFIQIFTGFALYGQANPGGLWWTLTSWVFILISNQYIRLIHHLIMWLIITFALQHVYTAFLIDVEEANGLFSSIFSGWKFIIAGPDEEKEQTEA